MAKVTPHLRQAQSATPKVVPGANRSTHIVKAGESLASVALRHYGDARFARLITTINRGDVGARNDGFSNFAFIAPGQVLALPTYEEANIFARHFFTQRSQAKFDLSYFARPAMPSDSIPVHILPSQGSQRRPSDEQLLPQLSLQNDMADWSSLARDVQKQMQGRPQPVIPRREKDSQFDCQLIYRQAPPADAAYISERMAEKITAPERVFDMTPPSVSVARLVDSAPAQDKPEVVSFSHYCRMIKFEVEGGQSDTIIKLQILEETRWQTITAYIITEETSRRLAHYDNNNRQVKIDLPCEVAKELSISDLKRNWKQYAQNYFAAQGRMPGFAGGDNAPLAAY